MSSSELESSDCESFSSSTSSEFECIIEVEPDGEENDTHLDQLDDFEPYADEPIADKNWMEQYEKEMKKANDQEAILKERLEANIAVSDW